MLTASVEMERMANGVANSFGASLITASFIVSYPLYLDTK